MNFQNTKAIARKLGMTTSEVTSAARDLGIEMNYRADNRYWEIADRRVAREFFQNLAELQAN